MHAFIISIPSSVSVHPHHSSFCSWAEGVLFGRREESMVASGSGRKELS